MISLEAPPWMLQATCRKLVSEGKEDPDLWFPDSLDPASKKKIRQAVAICSTCPVQDTCLNYAIKNREAHGIWGGLTARKRAKVRKQRMTG